MADSETIFGTNPVLEALRAGQQIDKILLADRPGDRRLHEIVQQAKKRRIPCQRVSKQELQAVAGAAKTQGVVAFVQDLGYVSVRDILAQSQAQDEPALLACLDGIEDPHNLGAILRSADGAGLHGVIIPKRRAASVTGTVAKTSAGAASHVLTAKVSNLNYAIDDLKREGLWFVGADQDGERSYADVDMSGPIGIVVGAEGQGLHRLVREKCDFLVKIPMYGKVNSLNASVAAALLFFEARRQRERKGGG